MEEEDQEYRKQNTGGEKTLNSIVSSFPGRKLIKPYEKVKKIPKCKTVD